MKDYDYSESVISSLTLLFAPQLNTHPINLLTTTFLPSSTLPQKKEKVEMAIG
jgi:hypothetical protein